MIKRHPKRIPYVLKYIQNIWEKNPDLRLAQLILNIQQNDEEDLYFVEDDELINRLFTKYGG